MAEIVIATDQELVEEALNLMGTKQKEGQIIQVQRALGTTFCEEGKDTVIPLLHTTDSGPVASDINYYLNRISEKHKPIFIQSWAFILDGVLVPSIMESPFEGWSTNSVLGEFRARIMNTPIPPLNVVGTTLEEDQKIEADLTRTLQEQHRVGYFFENWENFRMIKPIAHVLETSYSPVFSAAVLEAGQTFERCLEQINRMRVGSLHG